MGGHIFLRSFKKSSRKSGNIGSAGTIKAKKLLKEMEKRDGAKGIKKK